MFMFFCSMFYAAHRVSPSPFPRYTCLMVTTTLKPSALVACRAAVLLAFVVSTLSFPSTRARNSFPRSAPQPSASFQHTHTEQHPRTANALHARSQHLRYASSRRRALLSSSSAGRRSAVSCWVSPAVGCRTREARLGFDLRRMRHHDHHSRSSSSSSSRCSPRRGTSLSMKVKARGKKGGGGGGRGGGGASTASRRSKQQKKALYIEIEDLESDSWRYV